MDNRARVVGYVSSVMGGKMGGKIEKIVRFGRLKEDERNSRDQQSWAVSKLKVLEWSKERGLLEMKHTGVEMVEEMEKALKLV